MEIAGGASGITEQGQVPIKEHIDLLADHPEWLRRSSLGDQASRSVG
jgi:hypothetical protein